MTRPIRLSDWLAEIGNDNLRFQVVANCFIGTQWGPTKKRKASRLTFGTDEDFTSVMNGSRRGVVVWFDKEKGDAAMERLRTRTPKHEESEKWGGNSLILQQHSLHF
jgi:hypothetical protein